MGERELRVTSRPRSTSLLRVGAALVAPVLGGARILVTLADLPLFLGTSLGRGLCTVLTWMAMAVALLSGPLLTSDSLSMEEREGTLGFLFKGQYQALIVDGSRDGCLQTVGEHVPLNAVQNEPPTDYAWSSYPGCLLQRSGRVAPGVDASQGQNRMHRKDGGARQPELLMRNQF